MPMPIIPRAKKIWLMFITTSFGAGTDLSSTILTPLNNLYLVINGYTFKLQH